MPQSLVKILVHVVFSTKDRAQSIAPEIEPRLSAYIRGIVKNSGTRMIIAGGLADHIHLLISLGKNDISVLIGEIKRSSSVWMKEHGVSRFYWQRGFGAFSVSQSNVPSVREYVLPQKEHHANKDFKEEFRSICEKHEVEIDERYCWD